MQYPILPTDHGIFNHIKDANIDNLKLMLAQDKTALKQRSQTEGLTPFMMAIAFGAPEVINCIWLHTDDKKEAMEETSTTMLDTPLLIAASSDHLTKPQKIEVITKLKELYPDLNIHARNQHGSSLLTLAAEGDFYLDLRSWFEDDEKTDWLTPDKDGNTPLLLSTGSLEAYEAIKNNIEKTGEKIDYSYKNELGHTILLQAALEGSCELAIQLIQQGQCDLRACTDMGNNLLILSIARDDADPGLATWLLKNHTAEWLTWALATNNSGSPLFLMAAAEGHLECLKLLGQKSDWRAVAKDHTSALGLAARNGHAPVVKWLLENGRAKWVKWSLAETNDYGWTPFLIAAAGGHLECLKLLGQKINWSAVTKDNTIALGMAAQEGCTSVVGWLLENGSAKWLTWALAKNNSGWTPFLIAAAEGHLECLKLLAPFISIFEMNSMKETILHFATKHNHPHVIKWIFTHDFYKSIINTLCKMQDSTGNTAFLLASQKNNIPCLELLKPLSETKAKNSKLETTLHCAVNSSRDILSWLLQNMEPEWISWALNQSDIKGKTPLALAIDKNDTEAIQKILRHLPQLSTHPLALLNYILTYQKLPPQEVLENFISIIKQSIRDGSLCDQHCDLLVRLFFSHKELFEASKDFNRFELLQEMLNKVGFSRKKLELEAIKDIEGTPGEAVCLFTQGSITREFGAVYVAKANGADTYFFKVISDEMQLKKLFNAGCTGCPLKNGEIIGYYPLRLCSQELYEELLQKSGKTFTQEESSINILMQVKNIIDANFHLDLLKKHLAERSDIIRALLMQDKYNFSFLTQFHQSNPELFYLTLTDALLWEVIEPPKEQLSIIFKLTLDDHGIALLKNWLVNHPDYLMQTTIIAELCRDAGIANYLEESGLTNLASCEAGVDLLLELQRENPEKFYQLLTAKNLRHCIDPMGIGDKDTVLEMIARQENGLILLNAYLDHDSSKSSPVIKVIKNCTHLKAILKESEAGQQLWARLTTASLQSGAGGLWGPPAKRTLEPGTTLEEGDASSKKRTAP